MKNKIELRALMNHAKDRYEYYMARRNFIAASIWEGLYRGYEQKLKELIVKEIRNAPK